MFRSLEVHDWRQFGEVEIGFRPRLTVLTGANASGKTTLLNILARHFGWEVPFVRTPSTWRKRWVEEFLVTFWSDLRRSVDVPEKDHEVGHVTYADGLVAPLYDPGEGSPTFQLRLDNQQPVKGLHIPSHRPVPAYERVAAIPAKPRTKQEAFNNYMAEVRQRYLSGNGRRSATFHIKETLLSLAVGYGNEKIPRQQDLIDTLEGFEAVLQTTLPDSIGFREIGFDIPEVFLNTATGPIPFDAISGGMASIMDICWQIYMYSPGDEPFVVVIDEPENHLHPALQRTLLGNLIAAFPEVQFVVATHSPFVVGAVEDSHVYVLDYVERQIFSQFLETADRAASADGILREVLGVPTTFPLWVEREMDEIVAAYVAAPLTADRLRALKADLEGRGLSGNLLAALNETIRLSK